jgi:hypothetical protein
MVEKDGKANKKAFELFDNIVAALLKLGLNKADVLTMANNIYPTCAKTLKEKNWK